MDKLATNTVKHCKYCGATIVDGFCTKPCKLGKLQKEKAILEKKIKGAKE